MGDRENEEMMSKATADSHVRTTCHDCKLQNWIANCNSFTTLNHECFKSKELCAENCQMLFIQV